MEPITLALIPVLVATVLVARANASKTSMRLRWKLKREFTLAGEEMGLRYEEDQFADQIVLRGVREGIQVEATVPLGGTSSGWVSARPEGLNPEIQLKDLVGRSLLHGEGRELLSKPPDDIKVGDPHFDALVVVEGPRAELYAALTQPARAAVVTLLAHDGFVLKDGQLQIALTDRDGNWMRRDFASLLRAAQHFVFLEGRAARLLSNYRSEKNPTIALRNGACLLGEYAGSPEAAEVTELLLEEGAQRFSASSRSVEWRELLATLLVRRPKKAAALVDDLLTWTQDVGPDWPELAAIAMTLRGLDSSIARPLLWKMLESNVPHSVRIVAAMSMGRVGEVGDVQRLRELPTAPFTKMQEAINGAVELIQGRVEGNAGGGLALVGGAEEAEEAGGLTIASTEGALSEPGGDVPS